MIVAPTSCYFMLKIEGEAATQLISEISPGAGSDIVTAMLASADFESDLYAVNNLDKTIEYIRSQTARSDTETTVEKYNPLYIPGEMGMVDEALNLDSRTDGIRFVGFNGNPFILKTVEVSDGDTQLIIAKVEYRPFEIPTYSELVLSRDPSKIN